MLLVNPKGADLLIHIYFSAVGDFQYPRNARIARRIG